MAKTKQKLSDAFIANQIKPGEVRNPKGRPKGSISVNDEIRRMFKEDPELWGRWVKQYVGDPANWKHIHDHLDGKAPQSIEHSGEAALPFNIFVSKYEQTNSEETKQLGEAEGSIEDQGGGKG